MKIIVIILTGLVMLTNTSKGQAYNTRIGYSLRNITTGRYNTAAGEYALNGCSNGNYNTAFGRGTLMAVGSQSRQTAIGARALMYNNGTNNVGAGVNCLTTNKGSFNTGIGVDCGNIESSASYLVAIGYRSLYKCTANQNAAVGVYALGENKTGTKNTAIGDRALFKNITGNGNTAVGDSAAASYNSYTSTFVGRFTNTTANHLANVTAIGYQAIGTGSNMVRVGNSATQSIGGSVGWSTLSDGRFKKEIRDDVAGLTFVLKLRPVTYEIDEYKLNAFLKAGIAEKSRHLRQSGFIAQEVANVAKEINYQFDGVDEAKNLEDMHALRYESFVVPLVKSMQQLSEKLERLRPLKDLYEQQKLEIETLRKIIRSLEEPKQ